jgi:hypothetical protein
MRGAVPESWREILRDLDMVVYRLELPAAADAAALTAERQKIRRELERIREQVRDAIGDV